MPVFNGELFLQEAVRSIQEQTFGDFEFIIVDDGSTDRSAELIRDLASRDRRISAFFSTHGGPAAAAKFAADRASGEYIARMDCDDICHPRRLEEQVEFLRNRPDHVLLGTGFDLMTADGREIPPSAKLFYTEDRQLRERLVLECPIAHSSVMMRRDAYHRAGGYRNALEMAEDYDLWVRLACQGKIANLPEVLIRLRRHEHQISSVRLDEQMIADLSVKELAQRLARHESDPFSEATGPAGRAGLRRLGFSEETIDIHILDGYELWAREVERDGNAAESAAILRRALEVARRSSLTRSQCARYGLLLAKCQLRQHRTVSALRTGSTTLLSAPAYPFALLRRRLFAHSTERTWK